VQTWRRTRWWWWKLRYGDPSDRFEEKEGEAFW